MYADRYDRGIRSDREREPSRRDQHRDHGHRDGHRDRERERERDRHHPYPVAPREDRDRHREHRERDRAPVKPQQHIVVQGLASETTEKSLTADLEALGAALDQVRVVLDKATGLAKGFAFVKFISTQHAIQFMDKHAPFVKISQLSVRLEYSKAAPASENEWICTNCGISNFIRRDNCFQCSYSREDATSAQASLEVNDGRQDVSAIPSNILIVLGLDTLTSDETLHAAVSVHQISPSTVRIIKDRATHISFGFAFLTFPDTAHATAFLARVLGPIAPDGFRGGSGLVVDGRAVTVAFARPEAFVDVYERGEGCCGWKKDDAGRVRFERYRDADAYANCFPDWVSGYEDELRREKAGPVGVDDELAAFMQEVNAAELTAGAAAEVQERPPGMEEEDAFAAFMQDVCGPPPGLKDEEEFVAFMEEMKDTRVEIAGVSDTVSSDVAPSEKLLERGDSAYSVESLEVENTDPERVEELLSNEEAIVDVDFLNEEEDMEEKNGQELGPPEPIDLSDEALLKRLPSVDDINSEKSDLSLMACLLCERQFKSQADLTKHQVKSGLHKTNIQALREIQLIDLRAQLMAQMQQQQHHSGPYRNRAAERRRMYGQPSKVHTESPRHHAPAPKIKDRHGYGAAAGFGFDRAFPVYV
ncbi:hypothetical protein BC830DRAFT_1114911 [Chytriomyces sp. MP71]|nr:hypothetical protein BC830DRAFT_1114911 [Chytriomyces sp. MP71]